MSLKGKIVFITGASAGIGAATALAFAAEGARLLLAARRAGKLAEVASRALERGAPAVHSIDLDVRDHRAVQQAIDDLPAEWARDRHPGQQRRPQPRPGQALHGQD